MSSLCLRSLEKWFRFSTTPRIDRNFVSISKKKKDILNETFSEARDALFYLPVYESNKNLFKTCLFLCLSVCYKLLFKFIIRQFV